MTRLLVWRHGNTEWNSTDRVQGQTDVPLSAAGVDQAEAAAKRLAELAPDAIVTSDLRRALDTAATLGALTGLPVRPDPRLRERSFGLWQGHLLTDVRHRWPAEFARWRAGDRSPGCGIEPLDDLGARVAAALSEAAAEHPGGTVVAVSHGGAARHGCGALLGWPAEMLRRLGGLDNCHWCELRSDRVRGWQLRSYNVS